MKGDEKMALVKWRQSAPAEILKMSRLIAEEDGLTEIAKLYPAGGISTRRRSNGWSVSRYREVTE